MNTLTQDMSFSAIDERLPAAEQDEIFEVNTCLGKEDIHVVRQGQGTEHFLIWHGFDSVNRFYPWHYLLQRGHVTRVGLPGHGPVKQRPWSHCKHWSQAHFVETGVALSRKLHDGKPLTLIGHSTGALIALGVAINAPEIVARVVLINPLLWSPKNALVRFLVASKLWPILGRLSMGKGLLKKQSSVEFYYHAIDRIIRDHPSVYANQNIRADLLAGHMDYRCIGMNTHLGAARAAVTGDFRPTIRRAQSKVPALIVHGVDDPVAPVSQSEWLVQHMENAQLIKRPGVGHVAYIEREQEFIQLLSAWLDSHS